MNLREFEFSVTEKELESFGYYAEIRSNLAKNFYLNLEVLKLLEYEKMAREQLILIYEKGKLKEACDIMKADEKFETLFKLRKPIFKRFLFITAPLIREFNQAYLKKRDSIASKVGQNKTYVFEMTRNFQKLVLVLGKNEFLTFLRYKDNIAEVFERMPNGEKFEVLNLLLSKELYIMDISEEDFKKLFSPYNNTYEKVRKQVQRLIQK